MNINVAVTDANNIVCEVTPTPQQVITIDRGVAGNGIESISVVTISGDQYLHIVFTNGTTTDVGPISATYYTGTSPINVNNTTNVISLDVVPVTLGGTNATTASGARTNLGAAASATTISAGTGLSGGGDLTANRTLSIATTGVTAASYGSASKTLTATVNAQGQLTTLADTNIAIANTQVSGLGTASTLNAGVANGVATLDAGGTVPLSQIPASIQGGVSYQGTWNASTNTPTLTSSVGTKGYYYVVSVAGTTNLNGITDWQIGDWAIYSGTAWQKIDNTDAVTSVNGFTGTVVLNAANVGALSIANNLSDLASSSTARTNLGLGSIATQNANSVAITGGTIDGVSVGTTIASSGAFTSLTATSGVISANSSTDAFRITQIGSGNALVVEDSANPDSTPTVITTDGRLVVGNTTAITGPGANTSALQTHSTNVFQMGLGGTYWAADATGVGAYLAKSRGTSIGTRGIVSNGDSTGRLTFAGDDGTSFLATAFIESFVDGTPGTNDMPGRLVFSTTADGAAAPTERMRIDNAGQVGIGATPSAGRNLTVSKTLTGSTTPYGILVGGAVQSDATGGSTYFSSFAATAASAFTSSSITHFLSQQGTIGSGSTVTNQYGFNVSASLTGATNNYGFYGNIASGTGRFNLYMAGTADNQLNGNLGIGGTPQAGITLDIQKAQTGSTSGTTVAARINPDSTVTATAYGYATYAINAVGTGTTTIQHYYANQGTYSGTAPTNQYGFYVSSSLTGGTNNYGFSGNIASGTGRYNLYMGGTADNYLAGSLGIGTTSIGGTTGYTGIRVATNLTGATSAFGIQTQGVIQSDVTTGAYMFRTAASTVASAFTLPTLVHYDAAQGAIGATSAVTNQYGFIANSSLTGATNNFGFFSNIASGTGRYNFYAQGTAANVFAGLTSLGGFLGSESLRATPVTSAVNYVDVSGQITANPPVISAQGSDTNVGLIVQTKGNTALTLQSSSTTAAFGVELAANTSADRAIYIDFHASASIDYDYRIIKGSGINGTVQHINAGTGGFNFQTSVSAGQFNISHTASAVNAFTVTGSATGSAPTLYALGSDTDISINITPKGAGALRLTGSTSGYVGLKAAAAAGSTTYTLPSADGTSGQVLSTNGSGTLSWATGGGGSSQWTTTGSDIYYSTGAVLGGTSSSTGSSPMRFQSKGGSGGVAPFGGYSIISAFDEVAGYFYLTSSGENSVMIAADPQNLRASSSLQFATDGTERMRIDASGNVGIGTSSPSYKLQVLGTAYIYDTLTINSVNVGANVSDASGSNITLKAGNSNLFVNQGAGYITATVQGAERMRLNATGALVLSGGNTSANGVGITFPATQSASSDANTLDDYEEGTWTPTVGQMTGNVYSNQTGRYVKIGQQVTVWLSIQLSTVGTGGTWLSIGGLPFTSNSQPSTGNEGVIQATIAFYSGLATGVTVLTGGWGYNGSTEIYISGKIAASTATSNDSLIGASYAGNSFKIVAMATYRAA